MLLAGLLAVQIIIPHNFSQSFLKDENIKMFALQLGTATFAELVLMDTLLILMMFHDNYASKALLQSRELSHTVLPSLLTDEKG